MERFATAGQIPKHPQYGAAERTYIYRTPDGTFAAVNCWFSGGEAATWAPNCAAPGWLPPRYPVALYSPPANPDGPLAVLVFDEESADACLHLLPEHAVYAPLTPHPMELDLMPLKGRHVLLWPAAGTEKSTVRAWWKAIKPAAASIKALKPPPQFSIGWNASEAVDRHHWGASDCTTWLIWQKIGKPHVEIRQRNIIAPQSALIDENGGVLPNGEIRQQSDAALNTDSPHFQTLGHANGHAFFVPNEGGQILDIPLSALGKGTLPTLAPLRVWQTDFPGSNGVDWTGAADLVIRRAYRAGVHDPGRIRGRGAWWDDGRCVLHLGDRLLVDGVSQAVRSFKSRFVYEVGAAIRFADAEPLTDVEARRFPEFCAMLSWQRPISAALLAGWCAVAPICGALDWRPHIFLQGVGGAGKSWIAENVITRMLGQIGLFLAAKTSEPGVRRALRCDARPVIIDELEAGTGGDVERIRSIFHLMRYASSETGAEIVMGRTNGAGTESFRPRFCAATSAIGSLLTDYADVTRNSTLALKVILDGAERERQFTAIKKAHRELLTPQYVAGMQARIVRLIPVIRDNAETFASAGAEVLGARRIGDQIGALAAGRYACESMHRVTAKAAREWWARQQLDDEKEQIADTDGPSCLARIMQRIIAVQAVRGNVNCSIGELVELAHTGIGPIEVSKTEAQRVLVQHGLKVEGHWLVVANKHAELTRTLRDTQWPVGWAERLKTLPGAESSGKPYWFGAPTKAVMIPLGED